MENDAILAEYYRYMIHAYHMAPDISQKQLEIILARLHSLNSEQRKELVIETGK